jgi:cupin superfamily acireductone dioxygenase involved in methionine salvage
MFGEYLHLSFKEDGPEAIPLMKEYLQSHHHSQVEIAAIRPTIEDCFIRLLKQP